MVETVVVVVIVEVKLVLEDEHLEILINFVFINIIILHIEAMNKYIETTSWNT